MRMLCTLCLGALVVIGCSGPCERAPEDGSASGPVRTRSEREIGLVAASVFEMPVPEAVAFPTVEPSDSKDLPRPYDISPPRIPHAIRDLGPITADENPCMECHDGGAAKAAPRSHHVDFRHAADEVREELAGARHNCTACHVPQTGAPPLVANRFRK